MSKPKIRFKGFDEDWEQRKFKNTFDYLQNNALSRANLSEEGNVLNIHYGDVLIKFGEVIDIEKDSLPRILDESILNKYQSSVLQDGDVIIADAAEDETVGKCSEIKGITGEKVLAGLHTIPVRPKKKYATGFMGHYMNSNAYHKQLLPLMQGTKVSSISKSSIQETDIMFPKSEDEQQKIGEYFSNLDNLITLHQRKCEEAKKLKKYMLQKMFPQKGKNIPEIRFDGFTEDWEQRKLGEVVDRVTRKNQDLVSELPLTISAQYGLIDQNEFFDKRVASRDVSGYYLVENGEFAYNKSTSNEAPWGAIKRLDRYANGVLSTLYIVFKIKNEEEINSDFLVSYYDTNLWHKGIHEIAAEGARNHGLLNIAPTDFFGTKLMLPQDIEEQKKIGDYFKQLDTLITLHQRKYEELQKIKKFMLQNMFV